MTQLLPYLRIDDGTGCVEVVNNARTLAHIARPVEPRPAGVWMINELAACDVHACAEFNEADYTYPTDWAGNPAPWADPAIPASGEFFGLLLDSGSMALEAAWSSRRRGSSTFENAAYTPRTLTITGTIVASSARGTSFGEEWLVRQFLGRNCAPGRAGMFDARVLKHCPDPTAAEFTGWLPYAPPEFPKVLWVDGESTEVMGVGTWGSPEFGQVATFDWVRTELPGSDPCDNTTEAEPYVAGIEPVVLPDIGWRDLHRVRFVSMEDLDDEPMALCEGKRVAIVCEVLGDGVWWADDDRWSHWVLLERAFDPDTARAIDWTEYTPVPVEPCGVCGPPCRCDDGTFESVGVLPAIVMPECYRQPLVEVSVSVLSPALPWSVEAALVVEITGGYNGLENVAVTVWEAVEGVPDPATVVGCRVYNQRDPCSVAHIASVPPQSTLRIDGRRGRVTLDCVGQIPRPSEDMITGDLGLPFTHPRLSCGARYWVVVTADYFHLSEDASVRVRYVPVEVS